MYEKVGQYRGDLNPLYELSSLPEYRDKPTGYQATDTSQEALIEELFRPHLELVFPGNWGKLMIVRLLPNGHLPVHSDGPIAGKWHHLVLQNNEHCWNYHDGNWQQLEVGYIYQMDATLPHGSINWGDKPRVHFLIENG